MEDGELLRTVVFNRLELLPVSQFRGIEGQVDVDASNMLLRCSRKQKVRYPYGQTSSPLRTTNAVSVAKTIDWAAQASPRAQDDQPIRVTRCYSTKP